MNFGHNLKLKRTGFVLVLILFNLIFLFGTTSAFKGLGEVDLLCKDYSANECSSSFVQDGFSKYKCSWNENFSRCGADTDNYWATQKMFNSLSLFVFLLFELFSIISFIVILKFTKIVWLKIGFGAKLVWAILPIIAVLFSSLFFTPIIGLFLYIAATLFLPITFLSFLLSIFTIWKVPFGHKNAKQAIIVLILVEIFVLISILLGAWSFPIYVR